MMQLTDIIAPLAQIGLGVGRIGNFTNSELWGRPTDMPWAMAFPNGGPLARHPSQLYEAFLEGIVLLYSGCIPANPDLLWQLPVWRCFSTAVSGFLLNFSECRMRN